jgi:Relaxase/Mobilisation nuclease domain
MIINGGSRCNARFFANHLTNGEENERVTLCEIRNLAAMDVAGALKEMEAIALGAHCKNYFYHANINPQSTELLTPVQWRFAVDTLEENLGLKGHARFIVEHQKKSRTHRHVIWLRIIISTMRVVKMTDDYEKHQATSRQLEREFGLREVSSVLGAGKSEGKRPARRPKPWETFRGHQTGIDPRVMKDGLTELYRSSRDGMTFLHGLKASGYQLVQGDKQVYCIVDSAGHVHSLARRLDGVSTSVLDEFLSDISPDTIPSLALSRQARNHSS